MPLDMLAEQLSLFPVNGEAAVRGGLSLQSTKAQTPGVCVVSARRASGPWAVTEERVAVLAVQILHQRRGVQA